MIEVVLAVAIASIGIIAIMGLLPNAIQASRNATDNTLSATIAQDVFSNIRSQPLDAVDFGDGSGTHNLTNAPVQLTLNFDSTGVSTNATAYYKVLVSIQPQPTAPALPLWTVQAGVVWPALSPAATTNIFVSYVTAYN